MKKIFALAMKDLKLLWRDKFGLFWVIAFPLIMAIFFGSIFSGGGSGGSKMSVAVVDQDSSEISAIFLEKLKNSDSLEVVEIGAEEASEKVRKGKLVAFIVLKKGFGESDIFFSGGESFLQVGIDPARKAEAGYLDGILTQAYFQSIFSRYSDPAKVRSQISGIPEEIENDTGMDPEQKKILSTFIGSLDSFLSDIDTDVYQEGPQMEGISIEKVSVTREAIGPRSAWELTFPQSIAWGIIGCVAAFSISIVVERSRGTFMRLRMAPLSLAHILAGKALACFLASISVMIFLLGVGKLFFKIRIESPVHLAVAIICTALCFVGIMMFISVLGKTEQAVGGTGWAILLVMSMFGGGMIPLMFMPPWMKWGSSLSPLKWGILSIEGAIWRGFSTMEMLLPCSILLGVGVLFFGIGVAVFTRSES